MTAFEKTVTKMASQETGSAGDENWLHGIVVPLKRRGSVVRTEDRHSRVKGCILTQRLHFWPLTERPGNLGHQGKTSVWRVVVSAATSGVTLKTVNLINLRVDT